MLRPFHDLDHLDLTSNLDVFFDVRSWLESSDPTVLDEYVPLPLPLPGAPDGPTLQEVPRNLQNALTPTGLEPRAIVKVSLSDPSVDAWYGAKNRSYSLQNNEFVPVTVSGMIRLVDVPDLIGTLKCFDWNDSVVLHIDTFTEADLTFVGIAESEFEYRPFFVQLTGLRAHSEHVIETVDGQLFSGFVDSSPIWFDIRLDPFPFLTSPQTRAVVAP